MKFRLLQMNGDRGFIGLDSLGHVSCGELCDRLAMEIKGMVVQANQCSEVCATSVAGIWDKVRGLGRFAVSDTTY